MGAQSAQRTIATPSFDVAACDVESPNRILNDDSDDFIPCPREHDFHSISSPASNLHALFDAIPSGSEAINNPLKYSRYPPDQVYAVTYVIDRYIVFQVYCHRATMTRFPHLPDHRHQLSTEILRTYLPTTVYFVRRYPEGSGRVPRYSLYSTIKVNSTSSISCARRLPRGRLQESYPDPTSVFQVQVRP